jgi:hypothetical protein
MLSAEQMAQFEVDGATMVNLRLSPADLDAAEAVWDRNISPSWEDDEWVRLMGQPCFEAIAKQVLRSDKVYILEAGRAGEGNPADARVLAGWPEKHGEVRLPAPLCPPLHECVACPLGPRTFTPAGCSVAACVMLCTAQRTEWSNSMHTDNQVTTDDFGATPRRDWLAIWFWLNDVSAERAAMRVLTGSHTQLHSHWQEMQRLGAAGLPLPVRRGCRWESPGEPDARWAGVSPFDAAVLTGMSLLHALRVLVLKSRVKTPGCCRQQVVGQRGANRHGGTAGRSPGVHAIDRARRVAQRRHWHAAQRHALLLGRGGSQHRRHGATSVASLWAAVLTEIYLCDVCSCQEILRRNGRG